MASAPQGLANAAGVGQRFGFRLNDQNINGNNNDVIELHVNGGAASDTIDFGKQNFDNHTIAVLCSAPLAAPGGAARLVRSLAHARPASNLISAALAMPTPAAT